MDNIIGCIRLFNIIVVIIIVFFERREAKEVWAFILLLMFLPPVGLVVYLFCARGFKAKKMFRMHQMENIMKKAVKEEENLLRVVGKGVLEQQEFHEEVMDRYRELISYNLFNSISFYSLYNKVDFYTDGEQKFKALLEDIGKAKRFIHMEYFIIRKDRVFEKILEALLQKVKEGVKVRVLVDAIGSRKLSFGYFQRLRKQGIEIGIFFPALFGTFSVRLNYRNHRKLVVIDNETGYLGGFNIGKEYVGMSKKMGHWRDTHLRIKGTAVMSLQFQFMMDYNYATGQNLFDNKSLLREGKLMKEQECLVQIISGGPNYGTFQIRDSYLSLITRARKRIIIQTPYFIPDEPIRQALLLAARSGVEVRIMIPCKPDHLFVYWATYFYVGELIGNGARCYLYQNGFLHCKGMIVDGEVLCYGSANMDVRSFFLNYELNALIFCKSKAEEMERIFEEDIKVSRLIGIKDYENRGLKIRFKEQISRLLSPLL